MKFRNAWLPLIAVALAVPGAGRAQQDEQERPGMIGVSFDVRAIQAAGEPEPRREVLIAHVRRGSPAEAAGVDEGDVVIRINGRPAVESYRGLRLQEGDTVQLRIRRGADERDVSIVAAPRPHAPQTRFGITRRGDEPLVFVGPDSMPLQALTMRIDSLHTRLQQLDPSEIRLQMDSLIRVFSDSAPVFIRRMPSVEFRVQDTDGDGQRLMLENVLTEVHGEAGVLAERPFFMELGRRSAAGAELAEMNEGLRRYFENVQAGALVIDVSPNTPAARAGLEAGDVIVRAGGREVNDPEDVRRALMAEEDGSVPLEVVRQGSRRELTLQWEARERIRELVPSRVRVDERHRPERTRTPEPTRRPAPPRN